MKYSNRVEWLNNAINWRGVTITYSYMFANGSCMNGIPIYFNLISGREGCLGTHPYEFIFINISNGDISIDYKKQVPFGFTQSMLEAKTIFVHSVLLSEKKVTEI